MRFGFHLASLPHHDLPRAVGPLAEMGYGDVVARVDAQCLPESNLAFARIDAWATRCKAVGVRLILDADGLFMTDLWDATAPRLARALENDARETLLRRCVDLAAALGSNLVVFSVGDCDASDDAEISVKRISLSLDRLMDHARAIGVTLMIKPVLGSAIETSTQFMRVLQWIESKNTASSILGWSADIGVMARRGEMPIGDRLSHDHRHLRMVTISDVRMGVAGDQRFGTGDLAIPRIVESLVAMSFSGPVILRVEGFGDAGLEVAREAIMIARRGEQSSA